MATKRAPTKSGELAPASRARTALSDHQKIFLRSQGIDPNAPLQLDFFPDDLRAMPNDYARSALFTVRNKREPRAAAQGATIFHYDSSVRMRYTGIELRADDDELVWLQILNYAKRSPLGEPVEFNLHQMCKDLGWSINARNYDRVRDCVSRLKATEIKIENTRIGHGVSLSLISHYQFDGAADKGSRYQITIAPQLILLFAGHNSTRVVWKGYRLLTPIARRLHDYLASHKHPFPLALDTFHQMCGSDSSISRRWAAQVRKACAELVEHKLVKRAWVHEGQVFADR